MGTDRMTIPTPEEIERLADETLVWGTYMRDAGLIRKHLHGYATALRSLATIQRERDEARRLLGEADAVIAFGTSGNERSDAPIAEWCAAAIGRHAARAKE